MTSKRRTWMIARTIIVICCLLGPVAPAEAALGIDWEKVETGFAFGDPPSLNAIASNGSIVVAVASSGIILTSVDGKAWTQRTSGTANSLLGVVWTGSRFAAAGSDGTIVTSTDGISWSARNAGTIRSLLDITYGNGLYVVVGEQGMIRTSSDGEIWHARLENELYGTLRDVAWTGHSSLR